MQPSSLPPIDEVEALRLLSQREDPSARYYAAWWLGRERSKSPVTIQLFKEALCEFLESPNRSVASRELVLNVLRALVHLDAEQLRPYVLACLTIGDQDVAVEAVRVVASSRLVDASSTILSLLDDGSSLNSKMLEACLEALGDFRDPTDEVINMLSRYSESGETLVCSASVRSLLRLTEDPVWANTLLELYENPFIQIRRSVILDMGCSGWFPFTQLIAQSSVETSIKMIALRGIYDDPCGLRNSGVTESFAKSSVLDCMDELW